MQCERYRQTDRRKSHLLRCSRSQLKILEWWKHTQKLSSPALVRGLLMNQVLPIGKFIPCWVYLVISKRRRSHFSIGGRGRYKGFLEWGVRSIWGCFGCILCNVYGRLKNDLIEIWKIFNVDGDLGVLELFDLGLYSRTKGQMFHLREFQWAGLRFKEECLLFGVCIGVEFIASWGCQDGLMV